MEKLTKAQQARTAIKTIKTTSDALALRGFYKPSGIQDFNEWKAS